MPQDYQEFSRFLERLDEYLYERGFYINGYYIRKNCQSYEDVQKYLTKHCYDDSESANIVRKLKEETQNILKSQE